MIDEDDELLPFDVRVARAARRARQHGPAKRYLVTLYGVQRVRYAEPWEARRARDEARQRGCRALIDATFVRVLGLHDELRPWHSGRGRAA